MVEYFLLSKSQSGVDQLVEIIRVLGTTSKGQMNSNDKFPQIKAQTWNKVDIHVYRAVPTKGVATIHFASSGQQPTQTPKHSSRPRYMILAVI